MTYVSVAESARRIRQALRAAGWTSRDISVRSQQWSLGSSIYVTIKRPGISRARVEEIARAEESVRRDEITGEILSGGNRYMLVELSSEARALEAQKAVA